MTHITEGFSEPSYNVTLGTAFERTFGVKTMAWRNFRSYMVDGLFVLGGIAVGGPAMVIMATLFTGGI